MVKIGTYYTAKGIQKAVNRNKKRYKKVVTRNTKIRGITIYGYGRK